MKWHALNNTVFFIQLYSLSAYQWRPANFDSFPPATLGNNRVNVLESNMIAIQMNNKWQSTVLALVCQYGNYIHRFWFLDDLLCIIRFFQFSACFCSFFDLLDIIHYD